jgi:cold shock protein
MQRQVKFFNCVKGFGFIRVDDGSGESFVHISNIIGRAELDRDDLVEYEIANHTRTGKPQPVNVRLVRRASADDGPVRFGEAA